jgi:site-specific DNA-cytosine methylase
MRVLIACEYSGAVRDEFIKLGHDAMSCDLLPTDVPGPHYTGDVFDIINYGWDLMIAFPPCTHLALSGAPHFEKKRQDGRQQEALEFVKALMLVPIDKIAIENPLGIISSNIRPHDQVIQPYEFGDPFQKSTCLWLKNLPKLTATNIVQKGEFKEFIDKKTGKKKRQPMWFFEALNKGDLRWKIRSQTFPGIAKAMAQQWSKPGLIQGKLL